MRPIRNIEVKFDADEGHRSSLTMANDRRITKFFKMVGAFKGNRQDLYCCAIVSDCLPKQSSIKMIGNSRVTLHYSMDEVDYGEDAVRQRGDENKEEDEEDASSREYLMHLKCHCLIWIQASLDSKQ